MLHFIVLLAIPFLMMACQSSPMPAKVMSSPNLTKGPQVDAGVRTHQDQWLKGLVLDPDQTGVTTLVVMGDSYSDTGNLYQKTRTLGPPQIYWRSRFSNGPIWVDYVQEATGWKILNYAFADVDEGEKLDEMPITTLDSQVEQLQKSAKTLNREETLISLWIGPDVYRDKSDLSAVKPVIEKLKKAIVSIDSLGFHRVAVSDLPDLSQLPLAIAPKTPQARREFLKRVAPEHNEALKALLEQLKKERLDLRTYLVQVSDMQKTSREKAESAGVVLKQEACFAGDERGVSGERRFCRQPGSTQYWDATHPTSKLHCFYAAQFLADTADAEHIGGYNKGQAVDHCQQL